MRLTQSKGLAKAVMEFKMKDTDSQESPNINQTSTDTEAKSTDIKLEEADIPSSPPLEPSEEPLSPTAKSSIQGDMADFQLYKEKTQAQDAHELSKDLEEFSKREDPYPFLNRSDPLKEETDAQIKDAKNRADLHGSAALEKMQQKDIGWKEPVTAMKDYGAGPYRTMATMESFDRSPTVRKLEQDEVYNRYVGPETKHEGKFVTKDQYDTPEEAIEKLSLPDENSAEKKIQLKVDKGAKVFEGKANHLNGHSGGGHQIFVVDDNVVHEVKE